MAPKVNNKRARISTKPRVMLSDSNRFGNNLQAEATLSNGKAKALQLPLELLMEVMSHFKAVSTGIIYGHSSRGLDSSYLERTDALRSLSQTCKLWRYIFFPLLWERLDVFATHSRSGAWYQVFGETMIRKCFLVTENQEIASHVRTMSVILSRYSTSTVLPAFVRGVEALPNLKTLRIISAHDKMTTALKTAFDGHIFPQIETVILPTHAHNILRSCPEVKRVICIDGCDASKLISAIAKECRKVEEIERFTFQSERLMKRLVKATPNLRSIKFHLPVEPAILKPLAASKNLSHITLQSSCSAPKDALNDARVSACNHTAKDILKQSKSNGPKSIALEYDPNNDYCRRGHEAWTERIYL